MQSDDLTIRVLTEIRDEIRSTRDEVRSTNARLDQTNLRLEQGFARLDARIDQTRDELRHEIVEVELRVATRFTELTAATRDVHQLLTDRFDLRDRVDRCERDIEELKRRVS